MAITEMLSVSDVARLSKHSTRAIYSFIASGELEAMRRPGGKKYVIHPDAYAAWLATYQPVVS